MKAETHRGFALVTSLAMMILLVTIAIGLLSISAISIRSTSQAEAMAAAQANARLGLLIALGDLQKFLGPDQRISAPASILANAEHTHWTGVWSTALLTGNGKISPTQPIVGTHESNRRTPPSYLVDARESTRGLLNDRWKETLRLAWLVSGDGYGEIPSSSMIEIVGEGSVGMDDSGRVRVPKVNVGEAEGYAFWVSDESIKAKINMAGPIRDTAGFQNLTGSARPNPSLVRAGGTTPYGVLSNADRDTMGKILSRNQIELAVGQREIRQNFHDLTTQSFGIPVNVRTGGLQLDLTALLEQQRSQEGLVGIQLGANALNLPTILPGDSISPFAIRAFSAPRFDDLAAWYRLMDQSSGSIETTRHPTIHGPSREPLSQHAFAEGRTVDTALATGSGGNRRPVASNPSLHPVIADFKYSFDFSLDESRADGRAIRSHVYPRLILWNPYNTTIDAPRYVITMISPNSYTGQLRIGGQQPVAIAEHPQPGNRFPTPGANYMAFTIEPTSFGPGEALVFTPNMQSSNGAKLGNNSAAYDATNFDNNRLSATVTAGNQNFHFNSGIRVADGVNLNQMPAISFPGGVNQALCYNQIILLKRPVASSGAITPSILSSAGAPTIHRLYPHYNGTANSIWWLVLRESDHPANNAIPTGLAPYTAGNARNRRPPRLWYQQYRLRWLDESLEQESLGQQWGRGSAVWYHAPNLAHFNVRASAVFRSPFCFYDDWTRYSPGAFMVPWVSPQDANIVPPFFNGRSLGSPFGPDDSYSGVRGSYPLFDVPRPEVGVLSLAQFQHAQLSRHSWQPGMIVGHAIAEPRSDRDATVNRRFHTLHSNRNDHPWNQAFAKHTPGRWDDLIQVNNIDAANGAPEVLIYDMMFETNHFLWDDFFISSIPYRRGGSSAELSWNLNEPLPNNRLVVNPWMEASRDILARHLNSPPSGYGGSSGVYPFHHAAYFLMKDGAFNVNSTSVEAWRAVFASLRDVSRPQLGGGDALGVFSQLLIPRDSSGPASHHSRGTWNGGRQLTDLEIEQLAVAMVEEVRRRGPFLSIADFINRRLTQGLQVAGELQSLDDSSVRGALQAAIERSQLNARLQNDNTLYRSRRNDSRNPNSTGGGIIVPDHNAMIDWKLYGSPGYLTQADVLQAIGPQLTARGDTFLIRSYGEKRSADGKILATAWAEAIVQRLPDFIESTAIDDYSGGGDRKGNHPVEPLVIIGRDRLRKPNGMLTENDAITDINREFGRKFRIVSFRWLSKNEI